jgi:hypothetical protein
MEQQEIFRLAEQTLFRIVEAGRPEICTDLDAIEGGDGEPCLFLSVNAMFVSDLPIGQAVRLIDDAIKLTKDQYTEHCEINGSTQINTIGIIYAGFNVRTTKDKTEIVISADSTVSTNSDNVADEIERACRELLEAYLFASRIVEQSTSNGDVL